MKSLKEQYLEILTNGANLSSICDLTAREIGTPVAITLATRTIIAKSFDYNPSLVEEYTSSLNLSTAEEVKKIHKKLESELDTRRAVVGIYPYMLHKRINCGCFYKGKRLAVIDCPIVGEISINDAIPVIELAASIFLVALQLNSYISTNTTHPMQTYLIGLLRGEIDDIYQQHRLYKSSLDAVKDWSLIWISPADSNEQNNLNEVLDAFCRQHENMWYTEYENGFIILSDTKHVERLRDLYESYDGTYQIGISEPYRRLLDTKKQLNYIQIALKVADFEKQKNDVVFVKKYKMPMLFLSYYQGAPREEYENHTLDDMKKYDILHSTEYFETLKTFLLKNMDYNEIAKEMHIHRNTVNYRIQRISELFDLDLKDCRVITSLYLSLFAELL